MVLGWLYRRMFDGMVKEFSNWANEKDNKKYITDLVDSIADRQMARLTGSLGGTLKGLNPTQQMDGKSFIWQIIQQFLTNRQSVNNSSSQSELGYNPYGKT